jgi:endoglucanase
MMLPELSNAAGISGTEDAVRSLILGAIRGHVEDIVIDPMGSITAVKRAKTRSSTPLRVMLAAHMDEVGFMVAGADGDGLIRFVAVGGFDDRILPGKRVRVGDLPGVIIWTPIHRNRDQSTVKLANLRIDIGATSKDEALGKARRGTPITFDTTFSEIDGGALMRGKAIDDRGGCSLLIDILQGNAFPVEIVAAFTVQEEIGLRGARVAAQRTKPDVALVLEGTTANDVPNPTAGPDDTSEPVPTCRQGAGPVLTILDSSMIVRPALLRFLSDTAARAKIPFQYKSSPGGGTDGGAIHLSGEGVPTAVISLPCRYIHGPEATVRRDDYDHTLALVRAALERITLPLISD